MAPAQTGSGPSPSTRSRITLPPYADNSLLRDTMSVMHNREAWHLKWLKTMDFPSVAGRKADLDWGEHGGN